MIHLLDVHGVNDKIDISPEFSFDHMLQYVFLQPGNSMTVMYNCSFSKLAVAFAIELSSY